MASTTQRRRWRPWRADAETTLERLVREEASVDPSNAALGETFGLIVRLSRALLRLGLPAHRLEEAMERLAGTLGYELDALCTPTGVMLTLSDGAQRRTRVVRANGGDHDLERLAAIHALVERVERRELSPWEASRRLDEVLRRPERYGFWAVVVATAGASGASAVLLGGGLRAAGPGLLLGAVVGVLIRLTPRSPVLARLLPGLAALSTTLLARLLTRLLGEVPEAVLVIAAVIVLLPGFTLTVATMELASAHVVSGTARLVGGFATLVQLGFGVALGHELGQWWPPGEVAASDTPGWLMPLAYVIAALAFSVSLKAAPREIPWTVAGTLLAVLGAHLGNQWLGPELGALVGALVIGLFAHAYARWAHRPALLLLTPGILILVPGSVGFLSVSSMLESDVLTAAETGFRMILIATALAAGVLVASLAVPPRRSL